jgi:hypothetical protein
MATLAAYLGACVDHREVLAPGERGVLPIMAASVAQAAQAFNFVGGIFATAPNLKGLASELSDDPRRERGRRNCSRDRVLARR